MSVVSPEEIRAIPQRYDIGKRPLSLLLGWGELTYTRLLDGNTPNPAHAAELRHLLDDPAAFARLLETGRERITEAAYARSMKAVDALLADEGGALRATRIFAVADRLCKLAEGDLTPSALQRLVYYCQGYCFAQHNSALFDELPRASASGPAYDRIRSGYAPDDIQRIGSMEPANRRSAKAAGNDRDSEILSTKELGVIDFVYSRYGDYSGQALARMSREEAPWRKARKRANASEGDDCNELITAKSMRKYFQKQL